MTASSVFMTVQEIISSRLHKRRLTKHKCEPFGALDAYIAAGNPVFLSAAANIKITKPSLFLERVLFYPHLRDSRAVYPAGVNGKQARAGDLHRIAGNYGFGAVGIGNAYKGVPYQKNGNGDENNRNEAFGGGAVGKADKQERGNYGKNQPRAVEIEPICGVGSYLYAYTVGTGYYRRKPALKLCFAGGRNQRNASAAGYKDAA